MYHNNPINIALWEAKVIWPSISRPDVVLSLGTGSRMTTASPVASTPTLAFKDLFPFRVVRSFWSNMDGQWTWRDLCNRLDESTRQDYFRLSLDHIGTEPAMDDYKAIEQLALAVTMQTNGEMQRKRVLLALLTSSFFFELEEMPCFEQTTFICRGIVRSRTPGIVRSLLRLCTNEVEFFNGDIRLHENISCNDICGDCGNYSKRIHLRLSSLQDMVTISLSWNNNRERRCISAMPQRMSWYISVQGLGNAFDAGTKNTMVRSLCLSCGRKPKVIAGKRKLIVQDNPPSKRR